MNAYLIAACVVAGIAYLTAGLFASRGWWRERPQPKSPFGDDEIVAFAIVVAWPVFLAGDGVGRFVRWFYSR